MYFGITISIVTAAILIVISSGKFNVLLGLLSDWVLNLGVGILALYVAGHYVGRKMEFLINQKEWNSVLIGIIGSFTILLFGIFFGSTVGFLQEGIESVGAIEELKYSIVNYYLKPLYWIISIGFIPTILIGGIVGYRIKKRAKTT